MRIKIRTYLESMLIAAILSGIFTFFFIRSVQQKNTVNSDNTTPNTTILDNIPHYLYLLYQPEISERQVIHFLIKSNSQLSPEYVENIVGIYFKECQRESINVAIAISQMTLETGFLSFGGAVKRHQNNFAGMGSVHDTHPGISFATAEEGIRAHIQHLKIYASKEPLHTPCVDPRRQLVLQSKFFGKLKTVYDLSGTWAMDKDYGEKLAKRVKNLLHFSVHD